MYTSINYTIIKCSDCGEVIKIQPSRPFEQLECKCSKKVEQDDVFDGEEISKVYTIQGLQMLAKSLGCDNVTTKTKGELVSYIEGVK